MIKNIILMVFVVIQSVSCINPVKQSQYDICIYGGTSAGVIAAYSAIKLGKSVILIVPDNHVGGLSTGGLGQTDIGNKNAITGLSRDFYRRLGSYYGRLEAWQFEPKAATKIFNDYLVEAKIPIIYNQRLKSVTKNREWIKSITLEDSQNPGKAANQVISAKMFIDCTYEGDLMAHANISYTVGRESNALYGETYNGVQLMKGHQFPDGIDPYKIPGDPSSGLLWGISGEKLASQGNGDKKVQAYNFRICLTNNPANLIPITRPANYDSTKYELMLRLMKLTGKTALNDYFTWSIMPNQKTDINNQNGFSTDMIGMNWNYADASYAEREKILANHTDYTKGMLYFVGHDARVPEELRRQMLQWGYPRDEYSKTDNFSPQLYIREARRMIGELVMTEHHCTGSEVVSDAIGMAAYTMDSHNVERIVVNGIVKNEGDVQIGGFPPYPISYRSITPKRGECKNLLVPVCLSATHIAYGSIRMEPVFMVLAQSSAMAAVEAINTGKAVQEVDIKRIQEMLNDDPLLDGSIPDIIIDDSDSAHIQKTGHFEKRSAWMGQYGPTYLISVKTNDKPRVTFFYDIKKTSLYEAYFYCLGTKNGGKIKIQVKTNEKIFNVDLDPSKYHSEFAPFGTYPFEKGQKPEISVMSANNNEPLVVDAVLLKAKK
jgi:hypothetical protein